MSKVFPFYLIYRMFYVGFCMMVYNNSRFFTAAMQLQGPERTFYQILSVETGLLFAYSVVSMSVCISWGMSFVPDSDRCKR